MTLAELFAPYGANEDWNGVEISDITRDITQVKRGSVFVCTRGQVHDGHLEAPEALKQGAAAVVTGRDLGLENQLIVPDPSEAYASLCAAFYGFPAKKLRLIGVTGTNGKTTVTHMIRAMLERAGYVCGIIGTLGGQAGQRVFEAHNTTPDAKELHRTLAAMVEEECEFCVMEVSSHALDQGRVAGLRFEAGVFTNLTQDHLDYHLTMENYLAAKKKLFAQSDIGVYNLDDAYGMRMIEGLSCRKVAYSAENSVAHYTAQNIDYSMDSVRFDLLGHGITGRVDLKIPGLFSVYNALAAAACGLSIGLPFASVVDALNQFEGVKGRMERVPTGRDFTIVIDYAHTPDGLEKVLAACRKGEPKRLVVLFGCGGDRDRAKRPLMGRAAMEGADFAILTSDNPRSEDPQAIIDDIVKGIRTYSTPYVVIPNRQDAIRYAVRTARPGDLILLAGKGHETYQILNTGVIHLDEREIIAEQLAKLER